MADNKYSWLLVAVDRSKQVYVLDGAQEFFDDVIFLPGADDNELIPLPHEPTPPGCYLIQGITLTLRELSEDRVRGKEFDVEAVNGSWSSVSRPNFPEGL